MIAATLDHVAWTTRDPQPLHARLERLGFHLTPRSTRLRPPQPDGPAAPWGLSNRCAVLRDGGYLEVLAPSDPFRPLSEFDRYMDRYDGIHVIALGADDAEANLARLCRASLPVADIRTIQRPVDDEQPDGPPIRVSHVLLPEAPEGRLQLTQHLTPELIWQERFLAHPNRAAALEAVVVAVERPANAAARFSRLAGRPVLPDPLGGFALPLAHGTVRLLPPEALPAILPGVTPPTVPYIAAAIVRVDDGGEAIRVLLGDQGRPLPCGLLAEVGGGWVLFRW